MERGEESGRADGIEASAFFKKTCRAIPHGSGCDVLYKRLE